MTDRDKFNFSKQWFDGNIENWSKIFGDLRLRKIKVLEIGAFEGASTTWILENLLEHPESTLTSIDTFRGNVEHQTPEVDLTDLEKRFYENVRITGKTHRLTVMKSKSYHALVQLHTQSAGPFDFIYIDGSHLARDVMSDAVLCWPLLALHGFMAFDDYGWDFYKEPHNNPRLAIDAFLATYTQDVRILHTSYQMIVQKIARTDVFTQSDPDQRL